MPLLFVRKPWCHYLRDGIKTIELRPVTPAYDRWGVGTVLSINGHFKMRIDHKHRFADILACLEAVSPRLCGFDSIEHGLDVWASLYPDGLDDGVFAFRVSKMK